MYSILILQRYIFFLYINPVKGFIITLFVNPFLNPTFQPLIHAKYSCYIHSSGNPTVLFTRKLFHWTIFKFDLRAPFRLCLSLIVHSHGILWVLLCSTSNDTLQEFVSKQKYKHNCHLYLKVSNNQFRTTTIHDQSPPGALCFWPM